MTPGKYNLIYEFFKKQIEFGYYREGDCLPSVEILCSIYSGDFLPSYRSITKRYAVSFSTTRRAVELLANLGVAIPRQGLGIQVACPTDTTPSNRVLQRILSMFLLVIQMISISL